MTNDTIVALADVVNTESPVAIRMMPVKFQFIPDKESDEEKRSKANGHAADVDDREEFVLLQISQRDLDVIQKHRWLFSKIGPPNRRPILKTLFRAI